MLYSCFSHLLRKKSVKHISLSSPGPMCYCGVSTTQDVWFSRSQASSATVCWDNWEIVAEVIILSLYNIIVMTYVLKFTMKPLGALVYKPSKVELPPLFMTWSEDALSSISFFVAGSSGPPRAGGLRAEEKRSTQLPGGTPLWTQVG